MHYAATVAAFLFVTTQLRHILIIALAKGCYYPFVSASIHTAHQVSVFVTIN